MAPSSFREERSLRSSSRSFSLCQQCTPGFGLLLAGRAKQFHCVAQAFAQNVAAKMGDRIEQRHTLRGAQNCQIESADHVFQFDFERGSSFAQRGIDAVLEARRDAARWMTMQRVVQVREQLTYLHGQLTYGRKRKRDREARQI
jgi:hypothetical protein